MTFRHCWLNEVISSDGNTIMPMDFSCNGRIGDYVSVMKKIDKKKQMLYLS
ncbi:MAG: hypothetical protein J6J71_05475 [Prevotella sp.]|nr:hypothetical protein [Prevotella sp.]